MRGYILFATDPDLGPDDVAYRRVYATQAVTKAQAIAKVRPATDRRRLRAYLISGRYSEELAEALWIE